MTQEKIKQLQVLEQNLQQFLVQKQQYQNQIIELDSALEELDDTKEAYKIVGNIMVKRDKDSIKGDLEEKKRVVNLKLKSIQKQEDSLREKSKAIQQEVSAGMEEE